MNQSDLAIATEKLIESVLNIWPISHWGNAPIVVGVSGGADSVALIRILADLKQRHCLTNQLCVAHVNHGLRGQESDQDETFVRDLAKSLSEPFYPMKMDAKNHPEDSGEAFLREQPSYAFFRQLASETGARHVVFAHHRDDQVETFLFRLFRGSSLSGLCGIPSARELGPGTTLIRPFLKTPKSDLLTYLILLQQPNREDWSNHESIYTRNFVRNELLPLLDQRFGRGVAERLSLLQDEMSELDDFLMNFLKTLPTPIESSHVYSDRLGSFKVTVNLNVLSKWPKWGQRRFFSELWKTNGWPMQAMTRKHWQQLADLVVGDRATDEEKLQLPGGVTGCRQNERLLLTHKVTPFGDASSL
ncbi:MAG: tRNA lysidine(34) synthetase TilS [Pirellulaceae bacterium]